MSDQSTSSRISWAHRADNESVANFIADIITQPGQHRLAVPGGKTPVPIFADLCRRTLPWGTVTLLLTDDRLVPANHAASNQGKLEAAFNATAAHVEKLEQGMEVEPFDLVWLGMGADGHIASLFPEMEAEHVASPAVIRTCPDPLPPEAPFPRLSLNLPALTQSEQIMLVIRGSDKKRVMEQAIDGEVDLPIADLLNQARCPITIFWSQ